MASIIGNSNILKAFVIAISTARSVADRKKNVLLSSNYA